MSSKWEGLGNWRNSHSGQHSINKYVALAIHSTNLEHILCGSITGIGNKTVNKIDMVPTLKEPTF